MSRRESVGRVKARTQSSSGPPTMAMVTVAVLPPRLPAHLAPPSGIGMADAFNFDEALNWRHNQPVGPEGSQAPRKKSFLKRAGLTTERVKSNPDTPPFMMRNVPYDTWRKHYAKDKDGNYRGTHAPAEDCLLKPEDVRKWNGSEPTTLADKWTRGKEALPVYSEALESGMAPEYEIEYDGPPRENYNGPLHSVPDEPIFTQDEDDVAAFLERRDTVATERRQQLEALAEYEREGEPSPSTQQAAPITNQPSAAAASRTTTNQTSGRTIDGKTSEQVIAEAKAKKPPKESWRKKLRRGAEMASFGG